MDRSAVKRARRRLAQAQGALDRLSDHEAGIEQVRIAWSEFLMAAAGIYTQLLEGSGKAGPSNGWYGRIVNERSGDELLRYLHHARNSDYHGLQEVTHDEGEAIYTRMSDGSTVVSTSTKKGMLKIGYLAHYGDYGFVESIGSTQAKYPCAVLVDVTDSGVTYKVPVSHMDQERDFVFPFEAASAAMHYFRKLILAAEHFADLKGS